MKQMESLNILVIDDEPDVAAILVQILKRRFTAELQIAQDCVSARKLLLESHFDVITLDYQLPDGNGIELLKEIESMDNPPRVVMVTGHGDEQVAVQCFKLGGSGYVVKDQRMSVMLPEAIEHALSEIALEQAEKDMREAQERAREYLNIAAVAILAFNNSGEITMVNRKGCELLGLPEDELIGRNGFDLFIPEQFKKQVADDFNRVLSGGEKYCDWHELPLNAADGSEKIVNWHNTLLKDGQGRIMGFLASGEDITDLKHSERIARLQNEISTRLASTDNLDEALSKAVEAILETTGLDSAAIYIKDVDTGALDLIYQTGLSEDFIIKLSHFDGDSDTSNFIQGRKPLFDLSSDMDEKIPAMVKEVFKAFAVVPVIFKDEVVGSVNLASREFDRISEESKQAIIAFSNQIGQVIARHSLFNALKESEATYRTLFENAPEPISVFDTQGCLKDTNEATCNLLGYSREEILGKSVPELPVIPKERVEECTKLLSQSLSGKSTPTILLELITKDGERLYGNISGNYIKEESGGIVGAMTMISDLTSRVQKEHELQEYENKYQSVFENTKELIAIVDNNGAITSANPAAVEALGYGSENELTGTAVTDLYYNPEDRPKVITLLSEQGYFKDLELTLKKRDGSPLFLIGSGVLSYNESGYADHMDTVFTDITKLKETYDALSANEALFRAVFEGAEIGMALIDAKKVKIIRANEALCRITGYSHEELCEFYFPDLIHPEDRRTIKDEAAQFYKGNTYSPIKVTSRITKKDGSTVWLNLSTAVVKNKSGVIYAIGSAIDITDQKFIEDELRLSKERWERLFEEMADGITLLSPEFDILECNKALCDLTRKSREEIVGKKCHTLIHGTDSPPSYCVCKDIQKNNKVTRTELYEPHLMKNLEITVSPIHNQSGEIEQLVHVMHDITRRRRTEKELIKHREHLEELVNDRTAELKSVNRRLTEEIIWRTKIELNLKHANTELEDYAHTVSHDLKGPLSSITLSADMLQDEAVKIESEETRREILELSGAIKRHAGKSFRLADDLLALSRAGNIPEKAEVVNVRDIISEILEERRSIIKEKGTTFIIDDNMGTITADSTQIYVLFSNIINNAIIHNDHPQAKVTVSYLGFSGNGHRFRIKDNGSGIPEGEEENIFRAFRKGPVSEGTGVGLATAMKIVDVYSGEIKAFNDEGACFEFTIKDFNE